MQNNPSIIASLNNFQGGYTKSNPVLRSVSFSLRPGSLTAIIGPNGAGKSTILKALNGQLPFCSGEALVCSRPIHSYHPRQLARLVATASSMGVGNAYTTLAYTLLGRTPHRDILSLRDSDADVAIARESLTLMGVDHLANRPTSQLSEGQRQMVCLARAITQSPRLLLLDEPTANLDPANQQRILCKIKEVSISRQIATLASIHDINAALQWANDVILIKDGCIIALGPTAEVLTAPNLSLTFGTTFKQHSALLPDAHI